MTWLAMSEQPRGPFELHFSVGPFPVVVEPSFWFMTAVLGLAPRLELTLAWVAICFVSILVHELGHALAAHAFGSRAIIRLYSFGGLCYSERPLGRWRGLVMSAAGPIAGFVLGGLVYGAWQLWPPGASFTHYCYLQALYVNFGWGLMNLLPVLPLDGGHVFAALVGPTRWRMARIAGAITSTAIVAFAVSNREPYIAILFALLGFQNVQGLFVERDVRPHRPVPPEPDALPRAWVALRAGDEQEAARLGRLALSAARESAELNATRDLLAWVALAEGNPRAALSHLEQVSPPGAARSLTWALALEAADQPERALSHALAALEREPSDTSASLAVRLLIQLDRMDEAERICRTFAWSSPGLRDVRLADVLGGAGSRAAGA